MHRSSTPHLGWSKQNAAPVAPPKYPSWPEYASIGARMVHAPAWHRRVPQRSSVQMRVDRLALTWRPRKRVLRLSGPGPFGSIGCAAEGFVRLVAYRLA